MSHPPVQIVDEDDNVIGVMGLEDAHDQGKIHRISRVMIEDQDGNILLQKRSDKMDSFPGAWDHSAAGHVDEGESYLEAAIRELEEEIGIKDVELAEIAHYYKEDPWKEGLGLKRFNKLYKGVVPRDQSLKLQESEVADTKWVSLTELKKMAQEQPDAMTSGLAYAIKHFY